MIGALSCTLACCLPAVLIAFGVGVSATGEMAGVGHAHEQHGGLAVVLHLAHRISPALLLASIVLIAGAFALRRRAVVVPALLAGLVLYVSVHAQSDPAVMYAGMAAGYGAWIGLYLWTRPRGRGPGCAPEDG